MRVKATTIVQFWKYMLSSHNSGSSHIPTRLLLGTRCLQYSWTQQTIYIIMDWTDRYQTPLTDVWSRQHKLELEHQVELALLKALGEVGKIPKEAYVEVKNAVGSGKVTLARTLEIEKDTHHDIMAMAKAMTEAAPQYGGFVHYGATSQDINDTVIALQLKESQKVLLQACRDVRAQLTRISETYRDLTTIARTHGQHAIPITMGFKFANYLYEMSVAESFLERVHVPGKFGGAVGSFASLGTKEVEKLIMAELGLTPVPISTQVVSRLHVAEFVFAVSAIAAALERLGKEIRNLQRTEISETMEGFGAKQVGSSTMPQKRNPHKSERVCGLARIIRSQLNPSLETVSLEHERDLTNSSTERVTLPSAVCLTNYILMEMSKILALLEVDAQAVTRNLNLMNGKQLAERIMLALSHKLGRQESHEILRIHTAQPDFVGALRGDARVMGVLSNAELEHLLDPNTYIGLAPQIVDSVVAKFGVNASSSSKTNSLTYAQAGVNIDEGDKLVQIIKPAAASTKRIGADASLGGFGGVFDLSPLKLKDPLLVACTDGVGTKLTVAKIANQHNTIGIDLVAMSVNDLIVQGAEPLFFLDYYATSKLNATETKQVIEGIASACVESGCALVGGETAEMPGLYAPGDYDLAGFAVGTVERSQLLPVVDQMVEGDVVLGLPSSGIHSNGFSLVRRIVEESGADWMAAAPFTSSKSRLCDEILIPTQLYIKSLLPTLKRTNHGVKGLAHITGGGLVENIPRILPAHLSASLDASKWPILPVFKWLQGDNRKGNKVEHEEMVRVFNCGIGMVLIVSAHQVGTIVSEIKQSGSQDVYIIGSLVSGNHKCEISNLPGFFSH